MGLGHSRGLPGINSSLHSLLKGHYLGNVWKSRGQIRSFAALTAPSEPQILVARMFAVFQASHSEM